MRNNSSTPLRTQHHPRRDPLCPHPTRVVTAAPEGNHKAHRSIPRTHAISKNSDPVTQGHPQASGSSPSQPTSTTPTSYSLATGKARLTQPQSGWEASPDSYSYGTNLEGPLHPRRTLNNKEWTSSVPCLTHRFSSTQNSYREFTVWQQDPLDQWTAPKDHPGVLKSSPPTQPSSLDAYTSRKATNHGPSGEELMTAPLSWQTHLQPPDGERQDGYEYKLNKSPQIPVSNFPLTMYSPGPARTQEQDRARYRRSPLPLGEDVSRSALCPSASGRCHSSQRPSGLKFPSEPSTTGDSDKHQTTRTSKPTCGTMVAQNKLSEMKGSKH